MVKLQNWKAELNANPYRYATGVTQGNDRLAPNVQGKMMPMELTASWQKERQRLMESVNKHY